MTPTHQAYILRSRKTLRFYTGCTDNPIRRVEFHNSGTTKSTRNGIPWEIVWTSGHLEKSKAMELEKKIKKRGAQRFLQDLNISF